MKQVNKYQELQMKTNHNSEITVKESQFSDRIKTHIDTRNGLSYIDVDTMNYSSGDKETTIDATFKADNKKTTVEIDTTSKQSLVIRVGKDTIILNGSNLHYEVVSSVYVPKG